MVVSEFSSVIQVDLGNYNSILNDHQARLSFNSIAKVWLNLQNDCAASVSEEETVLDEQYWGVHVEPMDVEQVGTRRLTGSVGTSKGLCSGNKCPKTKNFSFPDRRRRRMTGKSLSEECDRTLLNSLQGGNPALFGDFVEIRLAFAAETTFKDFAPCFTDACQTQYEAASTILNQLGTDFDPNFYECSWNYVNCDFDTDAITSLMFFNDSISGTLSTEIGLLDNLEWFDLPNAYLTGTLPTEIFNLTSLKGFTVPNNYVTGRIPTGVGAWKRLTTLDLSGNELEGSVPTEVGLLESLEVLDLYGNDLTGSVPTELGVLKHLRRVDLRGNDGITNETVPPELCGIVTLSDDGAGCAATETPSASPTSSPSRRSTLSASSTTSPVVVVVDSPSPTGSPTISYPTGCFRRKIESLTARARNFGHGLRDYIARIAYHVLTDTFTDDDEV